MSEILTSGALKFTEANTPTRAGEFINTISEIYDIPTPRLGMLVYVRDEGKNYTITGLKEKTIEGVVVNNAQVDTYRCVEQELRDNIGSVAGTLSSQITATSNELSNAISTGDAEIKSKAAQCDTFNTSVYSNKMKLSFRTVDGQNVKEVDLPSATNSAAGVMSAEDKAAFGAPAKELTLDDKMYSGVFSNGTEVVAANPNFNGIVIPLTEGVEINFENGIPGGTMYIYTEYPVVGSTHRNKNNSSNKYVPGEGENYALVNIDLKYVQGKVYTCTIAAHGVFVKLDEEAARAQSAEQAISNALTNEVNRAQSAEQIISNGLSALGERVTSLQGEVEGISTTNKPLAGKTILCLGDSITEFKYQDKRYSDYLEEITGATVINGGIGGTQMGRRMAIPSTPTFTKNSEAYACFDLPSIAKALSIEKDSSIERFEMQEAAAQWLVSDDNPEKTEDDNAAIIEVLKDVDLDSVDIVTIFIGTNDIGGKLGEIGEVGNDTSYLNMSQGFHEIIKNLLTANPNLRIYYFSPMPRYFSDEDNHINDFNPEDASTDEKWCDNYKTPSSDYKFPDMVDHQIKLAQYYKIPVCDMYRTMGINQWNIKSIMRLDRNDGVHPYLGFKMLANKIASFIVANNNLNV